MPLQFIPDDPATLADPFPLFARLRDEDPAHWSERLDGWLLTRYDDCRRATLSPDMSADRLTPFFENQRRADPGSITALMQYLNRWMVFRDPPDHTRLRRLSHRVFTPSAIATVMPNIEAIVAELIDGIVEKGEADIIRDLAYPLPATVIMDMLGVPRGDLEQVKVWSDDMALFIGSAKAAANKYARAEDGARQMADYFREIIALRRKAPEDDVITLLVEASDGRDVLTEDEVIGTAILMLFAGHETTTNLIGNGILRGLQHPDEWARFKADPGLDESAIEEFLRYDGPSGAVARVVARDHELHGKTLRKGDRVFAMVNAANRDPRQFEDADRLDVGRANNRHLTFGHGIHFCLGAPLARLESRLAIRAAVDRLADMELVETDYEWVDSLILRGVRSLPVRFRPGQPSRKAA
ncbi:cytochrome P450 [Oceanibacterium hippocampi]|uniref:Biotin biosynthesis cytochrome P450 n=1 Tax=Oceanibacterium hippocampi TaxID=745714 RepID=A0A1Y5S836_9PROT|nr:cytochrome P450 [Oceanibacterium hippocampi]SLN32249.1 Biotin biosynthesis cytochrome P450 [Oceanibacterium hippocampi]